jgi:hypothetical protein
LAAGALRTVFSRTSYAAIAASFAVAFWTIFNVLDGLILISPTLTFYFPIPEDALLGFGLSIVTAALGGVVLGMNVFLMKAGKPAGKASLLSGSAMGTISSVCAGCSSVGFYIASTFGFAGVAASSFLANYQMPLRVVAVAILVVAFFIAARRIAMNCKIST